MTGVERLEVMGPNGRLVGPFSLELSPGSVHALVGESGSGKTLTLRTLAGAVPAGLRATVRRFRAQSGGTPAAAMIFQDPAAFLNPRWRASRSISEVLRQVRKTDRSRLETALRRLAAEVGLQREELERYPHQLSGGMVQRAAIAMALAAEAPLILADEITSALDPDRAASILQLLRERATVHQCAVLFASHDLRLVAAHADQVSVLYDGRLVERIPARELLTRPRHRYTAALVAALPRAALRGSALPELPLAAGSRPAGACPFLARCPVAIDACRVMPDWDPSGRFRCHVPEPGDA